MKIWFHTYLFSAHTSVTTKALLTHKKKLWYAILNLSFDFSVIKNFQLKNNISDTSVS